MANERLITQRRGGGARSSPASLDQLLHPTIDPKAERNVIATGLPASPGAASGEIVFYSDEADASSRPTASKVILVRVETSPEDIHGMHAAEGILTDARRHDLARRGGRARHGQALRLRRRRAARRLQGADHARPAAQTLKQGDIITIDGSTGEVLAGARADDASPRCPASSAR